MLWSYLQGTAGTPNSFCGRGLRRIVFSHWCEASGKGTPAYTFSLFFLLFVGARLMQCLEWKMGLRLREYHGIVEGILGQSLLFFE